MEKAVRLSQLPPGRAARVAGLEESEIKRRLISLGISEGAELVRLFSAASGDPTAYLVRETVVAIRERDARTVLIGEEAWA